MPTVPGAATNPYLSIVEEGKREDETQAAQAQIPVGGVIGGGTGTSVDDNPYERELLSRKLNREMATQAAILPAIDANPDEYAGQLTLARESGLPIGAVQADPQAIAREQRQNKIIDTISKSPTLQAWTAIDDNAVLAMDDFENLSALEVAMRGARDLAESPFKGFNRSLGAGIKGVGALLDSFAYTADRVVFGEEHAQQYLKDAAAAPWWVNPSNALRGVGGWVEAQAGPVLGDDRRNFATDVGEGLGTLIGQALATRLNPGAGVTLMAGQGADEQADRADAAGATAEQKAQAVVLGAAITAASEKMGLDLLLNRMPPQIKNRAAQWIVDKTLAAGIEGTEEAVEAVGNNLVAQMLYDPNNPIFEGVADNATVGGAVGFIARSLLGVRGRAQERQNVASEQTALDGMVTAAGASKLLTRAPERFQALVQQMAQAGATNVYVPAEEATKLFQSLEPAQVAEALGVPVEIYMEAVITGGDVAIPVEQYLSKVAPEHHDALREVARFTPGAMTPAETAEMDERAQEAADRFMASVQSEMPSDQMVHDDVTGMLLGTGRFRREDVERYAQVVQAGFRTLATREGMDPFALYQRYRLRIKSELPAALQALDVDTVIDPLIERLRTGDVPRGTKRQSLADFIAAGGGVDDAALAGEIATLHESDRVVRKGKAPLVRKGADRDLDRVREAAAEAGFLPADSDVNDLLNLLDEEMSGRPTYAMGDEADAPDDRTIAALDSLDEELGRLGIDVQTASNADIKRALFGESGTDVPDALVQVFDQPGQGAADAARDVSITAPPGFAGKAIDDPAPGETWYHGRQGAERSFAADRPAFFARDKESAEWFAQGDGATTEHKIRSERPAHLRDFEHALVDLGYSLEGDERLMAEIAENSPYQGENLIDAIYIPAVRHEMESRGFDSLIVHDTIENTSTEALIVWNPEQIDPVPQDVAVTARTKSGEFRLVDAAVPEMAALQSNGWTREIKAFDGETEVGSLLYANDGTPPTVEVAETHRRRGVATAMYTLARRQGGDLGNRETGVTNGGAQVAPLSESAFYRSYAMHFDIRGKREGSEDANRESIARDGFRSRGTNLTPAYRGGEPTDIVSRAYAPKAGDTVYLIPKEGQERGGSKITNGWKPRPWEVVVVSIDNAPMYEEYLRAVGEFNAVNREIKSARSDDGQAFRSGADESTVTLFQSADQTQTPEFKAWFGDSKVVDADGKPLVVYHGTVAAFDAFDNSKTGANDNGLWGRGHYFAASTESASSYALRQGDGARVIPAYVSIQNPLVLQTGADLVTRLPDGTDTMGLVGRNLDGAKIKAIAEAGGHDGVIQYKPNGGIGDVVAFRPEQIKSATANRGTFDPSDPSILNQSQIDEATGLPLNADGTVTVYHHTNAEAAEEIRRTGRLKAAAEPSVYVTTRRETDTGYGDTAVPIRVDPATLQLDDEFPDGRRDFSIDAGRPGGSIKVVVGEADATLGQPADGTPAENAIRRGYIKFGPDRHFTVGLLEKADATTFLHETGHFFLEVMGDLAADPLASDTIRSDYATLLQWFGVESREQIKVEHHEMFARGFEQYLGEGKAPTAELAPAFARFKAWVKAIYRTLTALNVPLTDDVRAVMGRLLATDEEITNAEQSMDYSGLFADARSAGWSDAEFATRLTMQEQAREEAESRLMARAMKDVTRETKAWWKERSAEVREQVTAEVHSMPVYRAWALLANGTEPDGTPIEGAGQKLDKAWLVQQYGQEWLNKNLLRKRVYSVAGGADPDVAATGVGFGSGDEMVRALANMQPMEAVIRAQTHQRMIDQYGDMLTDGSMPEQAMRAVHGSRRFRAMEADLKALERLAGDPRPSAAALRRTAELIIGQKKVRDLAPNTYLRAERKAAKEAITEAGRQNWGKALEAQRRRLLNAHLFDVASKAAEETEKLQRYIRKFEKPALRARLGKIGRLDQVEALLSQYDLRTVSNKRLDQNKARGELLALIQSGEVIAPAGFVQSLQGGQRTNWRELSVEDLRGLRDILRQTEAAARAEYEALINGEKVKLDDIAEQIGGSTIDGGKPVMPIYGDLSPDESAKKWGKQMLASWLRPSALARLLDGGKDDGAWTRHVIQPVRRAVSEVLEPMKRKAQEDLSALYRKHYTVKEMAAMNERSVVPGLGIPLSRWDVISLALNQGNAENRKAILDSEVAGRKPYTEAGVQQALATLDARDWAFVQETWNYVDSYWPAIKEAQVRRKGIAPPKVEAVPFTVTTRDGQTVDLKGGYYPLKYNGRLDAKARQNEMDEAFERMRAGTLSATQTKYGHTQERVGSGRQPVMLSMTVLHSHINNVVMDLALGDVVGYTDRILARPQVRQALIETGNLDALDTWKLWLKDTATGEIGARTGADQLAQFLRFGFTKSKVGFNAMTMMLQVTGLAQTIPVVGAGNTAAAALDFAGRPRAAIAQVMQQSAFMRTRYELNAFNKDIAAVQEALRSGAPVGKGSGFVGGFIAAARAVQMPPKLVSWAFFGIRQMQILVDSTTWLAGYRRAAGEGKSHDEAVRYADGIVENAQTSGMFSDRSAIERGTLTETTRQSEFVKLWTTLMSYMIAKGNIAFESYRRTNFRDPRSALAFGSDMLLLFAAEALLMGVIRGGLPDDEDDEAWWSWTGKTMGQQALSTIPFVREIPGMKYGGGNTPIGSTAGDLYKAFNQSQQGEVDQALVKAYVNLIGTATGLPSAQANRAIDAYWRESSGEDVPAYEYVTGKRQ